MDLKRGFNEIILDEEVRVNTKKRRFGILMKTYAVLVFWCSKYRDTPCTPVRLEAIGRQNTENMKHFAVNMNIFSIMLLTNLL